jgi:hypothetical protein
MRPITSAQARFATADCAECNDSPPALAQSALHITRAALARWSGNSNLPAAPARDLARVSPQARWLANAQYGLAAWIARGGFAQDETPTMDGLPTPVMYQIKTSIADNACID